MLKPVERQNLSNQVFEQLRDTILSEEYSPGERLPSERELCDILKINRSSVREALKRLEEARLIRIRHGEGSVVQDFRNNAGFDLLRHLVMPGGRLKEHY
jgi:GntR family transcriptional regulator, transcriptional repressor for pyruvate dehydrogenase complex